MDKKSFQLRRKTTDIIGLIDQMVYLYRAQAISEANNLLYVFFDALDNYQGDTEIMNQILSHISTLQDCIKSRDYVLMADYLELLIRPILLDYMESRSEEDFYTQCEEAAPFLQEFPFIAHSYCVEEWAQRGYRVEYNSCGEITLAVKLLDKYIYYHSNHSSYLEDWGRGARWKSPHVSTYHVLGLGMGNHVFQMIIHNPEYTFYVYESDPNILELMAEFSLYSQDIFAMEHVHIIYDPGYHKFLQQAAALKEEEHVVFHYPSILSIKDSSLRDKLIKFYIEYDNSKRYQEVLRYNFYQNLDRVVMGASDLKDMIKDKDVYIVAGGPSRDINIDKLRKRPPDSILLTVGTSLRRLVEEDIKPDYAMITDPKQPVYEQIRGLEESQIPLLVLSTTYYKVAMNYQGPKYIMFQKGYDLAATEAEKRSEILVESGSSVITVALDYLIRMHAKRLIFLGLDMAFTGNKQHHGEEATVCEKDSIMVEDIYGKQIPTSQNLMMYREWIERRIADESEVEIIDATEGGAKVKGMKIMTMDEVLKGGKYEKNK